MDAVSKHSLFELFSKAKKIADYEKLRTLHYSICKRIGHIDENMLEWKLPTNPRQDMLQKFERQNLPRLKRQKERIEKQMVMLEELIKEDIEQSKDEEYE